jgi:hypothetical protein
MITAELWTALAERNEFIPPSEVDLPAEFGSSPASDAIFRRLVTRWIPDLPGPLPKDCFDVTSARAAGALVASALARLHIGNPVGLRLTEIASALPHPETPAAHVTQAAILWYAVPLAKRLQSEAFRALNRGESAAESKEAVGEILIEILSRRPLLSLREGSEDLFSHSPPPVLDGVLECPGLRRWVIQRLASPCDGEALTTRWSKILRQLHEDALRETLVLLGLSTTRPSAVLLAEFLPLLDRRQWPEDLAPALRQTAMALRQPSGEDPHDRPTPGV